MRQGGMVGGVDAVAQVDPNKIIDMLNHEPNTLNYRMLWQGDDDMTLYIPWLKWYLERIQATGYTKKQGRREDIKAVAQNFKRGVGDIIGNFREHILGFVNDPNEHK